MVSLWASQSNTSHQSIAIVFTVGYLLSKCVIIVITVRYFLSKCVIIVFTVRFLLLKCVTSFSIVFTVRCLLSRFLLQPFSMPGYFQNSRYLVLSAQLEDVKAEAADAKQRGNKAGHTKASKKVRALTLGQYSFCFFHRRLKVCALETLCCFAWWLHLSAVLPIVSQLECTGFVPAVLL